MMRIVRSRCGLGEEYLPVERHNVRAVKGSIAITVRVLRPRTRGRNRPDAARASHSEAGGVPSRHRDAPAKRRANVSENRAKKSEEARRMQRNRSQNETHGLLEQKSVTISQCVPE